MCAGDTHIMCLCACFCVMVESIPLELATDTSPVSGWKWDLCERSNFILERQREVGKLVNNWLPET